ncbi:MAG: VWA domain-containing protein [Bacteroidales bacterium]|nr:VWA domain-containing protein [Bacteroidales bacterium]
MKPIALNSTLRQKMMIALTFMAVCCNCSSQPASPRPAPVTQPAEATSSRSIKLAILLDTSNSMDGLIDQAKSQLWSIVNELAKAKCDNAKPELKIALYEYGNSGLTPAEGYIRMVTPLTDDLDQISEDLFSLKTNGGQEFCGHVIQTAMKELQWSNTNNDYQVIFIAGNEPFTQGNVDFRKACTLAKSKGVVVNTIFCGDFREGMNTQWKDGAILTGGNYSSIEQDRKTVYIESPYDKDIVGLNEKLNKTYVYYGVNRQIKNGAPVAAGCQCEHLWNGQRR